MYKRIKLVIGEYDKLESGEDMRNQDIYSIAVAFRTKILKAKHNRKFDRRDRMSNFPHGCCDDSCDLLSHYLHTTYGIYTEQRNGTYRDNNPDNTTNHAWLIMADGIIIDITADQFDFLPRDADGVYVGKENLFYSRLDRIQTYENCNIMQNERLWNDYQIIMSGTVI